MSFDNFIHSFIWVVVYTALHISSSSPVRIFHCLLVYLHITCFLSYGHRSSMRISVLAAGPEQFILKYNRNISFNQTIIPIEKDCISFIAHLLRPESVIMETLTGGSSNGYSTQIMAFRISNSENPN